MVVETPWWAPDNKMNGHYASNKKKKKKSTLNHQQWTRRIKSPSSRLLVALQILPPAGLFKGSSWQPHPRPTSQWQLGQCRQAPPMASVPSERSSSPPSEKGEGNGICACPLETGLRPCAEKGDFVIPLASCQTFHPSLPTGQAFLCSFVEVGCEAMYFAQFLSTFLIILPSTLVAMDFEVFLSKQAALHRLFLLLPKSQITRVLRIFLWLLVYSSWWTSFPFRDQCMTRNQLMACFLTFKHQVIPPKLNFAPNFCSGYKSE